MPASPITHRAAKNWIKITIEVDQQQSDAVAAYLTDLTGAGLEISVSENGLNAEADIDACTERITAYLQSGSGGRIPKSVSRKIEDLKLFLAELCHIFPGCREPLLHTETILEEDWGRTWKSFFTAFHITPHLIIKPSWEETGREIPGGSTRNFVIEMDPGLAFGTGHHASTQLALQLLDQIYTGQAAAPKRILDVGTGSGILAMACALFGAGEVQAIDNDPDAVATAQQNIARNRLEHIVTATARDIGNFAPGFDLVVANITHDTLAAMAETLIRLIKPGGYLVLSGILKGDQEDSIRSIYGKRGLLFLQSLTKDEWAALQFQKK